MNASAIEQMTNTELLVALCGPSGRTLAKHPLLELFGLRAPRQQSFFACEDRAQYIAHPQIAVAKELWMRAMHAEMEAGIKLNSPGVVNDYLRGKIGGLEYEVFCVLFLDAQLKLISAEEIFRGTVTETAVYPREIVKQALSLNAANVMLAHNHPSGDTMPSSADKKITTVLKTALSLVDVRVLNHIIVGGNRITSFAHEGLI